MKPLNNPSVKVIFEDGRELSPYQLLKLTEELFEVKSIDLDYLFKKISLKYIEKGNYPELLFIKNDDGFDIPLRFDNKKCYESSNLKVCSEELINRDFRPSSEFYYSNIIPTFPYIESFILDNFRTVDISSNLGKTLSEVNKNIETGRYLPFTIPEIPENPRISENYIPKNLSEKEKRKVKNELRNLPKDLSQYVTFEGSLAKEIEERILEVLNESESLLENQNRAIEVFIKYVIEVIIQQAISNTKK
ncbi:MAG: hypothetical protein QXQ14_02905 [Candidatus Aenigmatarchaeota archaeon]